MADSKERVKELTKQLEEGVKQLNDSDSYKAYLQAMSHFHAYSYGNAMLIYLQCPDATKVAGYKTWQKLNRQVRKGEKGISILAPTGCYTRSVEEKKVDSSGNERMETREVKIPTFRTVSIFDISQTDGEPLPKFEISELNGAVSDYENIFASIADVAPCPITFEKITNGSKGYYSRSLGIIAVNEGMSEMQTIKTLIHEVAHSILHCTATDKSREQKEVEAESVAFVVSNYYGIDTSDYSIGYITRWGDEKLTELKESLTTIQLTADSIISKIDKALERPLAMELIHTAAIPVREDNGRKIDLTRGDDRAYVRRQAKQADWAGDFVAAAKWKETYAKLHHKKTELER